MKQQPDPSMEVRRRKLAFRASRRGFRELDLFMRAFVETHLHRFDDRQLDEFEQLLDIPDQHVFDWIMGRGEPASQDRSEVLDLLLSFRYSPPT